MFGWRCVSLKRTGQSQTTLIGANPLSNLFEVYVKRDGPSLGDGPSFYRCVVECRLFNNLSGSSNYSVSSGSSAVGNFFCSNFNYFFYCGSLFNSSLGVLSLVATASYHRSCECNHCKVN